MAAPVQLCRVDDIEDGESIALIATINGTETPLCVVRQGDGVFAYVNSCPHIGGPLDFTPGTFLSLDKQHIQCSTHGALFRIDDGYCVSGPCTGEALTPVAVNVVDGVVALR